jgi:exocyst complex component 4
MNGIHYQLVSLLFFSSSFDGPDDNSLDMSESDGHTRKDSKSFSREIPIFLSCATPDEFLVCLIVFASKSTVV